MPRFNLLRRREPSIITRADRAREAGQWQLAAGLYHIALERNPKNPPIWIQYGHALKHSSSLTQAEDAYRTAIGYDPADADAHLHLGHVLKLKGKIGEARAAYLRSLEIDPSLTAAAHELVAISRYESDLSEGLIPDLGQHAKLNGYSTRARRGPLVPGFADDEATELVIDQPEIALGRTLEKTIRGGFRIGGWALARDGISAVNISIDGRHFGTAKRERCPKEVVSAWPNLNNSRLSGYSLWIPARALATGEHLINVELRTHSGRKEGLEFRIESDQPPDQNPTTTVRRKMPRAEIDLSERTLSGIGSRPLFGLVITVPDTNDYAAWERTFQSLQNQVYDRWHAILVPIATGTPLRLTNLSERVTIALGNEGESFSDLVTGASGERPDFVGLISAGDVLGCDALLQMALSAGLHPEADFFYADESRISPVSGNLEAFFKPQWSPDLLLATNYIGRVWCAKPNVFDRIDARLEDWREFGEYDLIIRCTEVAQRIHHIPHLLCERGVARIDEPEQERYALLRAMIRRCIDVEITDGCVPGYYRLLHRSRSRRMVSIIVPTSGSREIIRTCIESVRKLTRYQNFEIIVVESTSENNNSLKGYLRSVADKVIEIDEPFNWARFNNRGAREARGEFLLFLNDNIEVIDPAWLEFLVEHGECPGIGVTGARLLYPDGKVRHAGMFWIAGVARHAFRFASQSDPGYFGLARTTRNVTSVTGACMMVPRSWFEVIGGIDERNTKIASDVDLCLRTWSNGRRVVYEPGATLVHHEQTSSYPFTADCDIDASPARWVSRRCDVDPYYHPDLSRDLDDYSVDDEPIRLLCAGYPLFNPSDIRRILVSKLDHIGDFITALPALRRLKAYFPEADLYLLAPQTARVLVRSFLPEIKEVIGFELLHTRAPLGRREISNNEFVDLRSRLTPYRFDLAIDLRKDHDTRDVLRFTGARWCAGFDRNNCFPWLDVAVEWESTDKLVKKRSHVSAVLCRLIDAVALATKGERQILSLPPDVDGCPLDINSDGRQLVCVHPAAGTETKQWPAEHFAALIDLLVMNHDVDVILVGGPDDTPIAENVLVRVTHKQAVRSFVGRTTLPELSRILASAALFVGNDSGPKHIAAGLGIAAIGIHSGVNDPSEWGPVGPNAVAVQREMRCSPCYWANASDCRRDLACLTDLYPTAVYEVCKQMLAAKLAPLATVQ